MDLPSTSPREVVLLGSTGSIGTQAVDVVAGQPGPAARRRARRRRRPGRPARPAGARARRRGGRRRPGDRRAGPAAGVLRRGAGRAATAAASSGCPRSWPGRTRMTELAAWPCDVVLNGMTGSVGLAPTLAALRGRPHPRAGQQGVPGRRRAAGHAVPGPDRAGRLRAQRAGAVPARRPRARRCAGWCSPPAAGRSAAARAPSWRTSRRSRRWPTPPGTWARSITVNSATLVNKGLEVIEAHLLFDVPYDAHRRRRAPAVGGALDGRVRRRLDARRRPARRTCGCRSRSPWPGRTGCPGRRSACDWTAAADLGVRAAGRRGVPGRRAGQGGRRRAAARRPRRSTRPTRSAWRRSWPGGCRSSAIVDTVAEVVRRRTAFRERPDLAEVLETEEWARRARPRAGREAAVVTTSGRACYLAGRSAFVVALLVSVDAARGRPLPHRPPLRHEGHAVLRRLRPDAVLAAPRRDRVRRQGRSRPAAS